MSRQVSGAEIAEKKTLLCGKVCFGLITAAVKPGANISLQRAGIEQNRKGRPTQIVIGLQSTTSTFGPTICFLFYTF